MVHPNYLILAAVLLPAAVAAGAALATDALIGGLALLALGVEIAEGEIFATTWGDAVAGARWPREAGCGTPWPPAPAPRSRTIRSGSSSARSPAGWDLVIVGGALRMGRRARATVLVLALVVLAVVPTCIVMTVGRLSGRRASKSRGRRRVGLREGREGPAALREAWSDSFRKDPPGSASVPSDGSAAFLADVLGAVGLRDLRAVAVLALGAAVLFLLRLAPREAALERVSLLLLPPAIVGVTFGSGDVLLPRAPRRRARGDRKRRGPSGSAMMGAAAALFPRLAPPAALLARAAAPAVAAFAAVAVVVKVVGGTLEGPLALGPGLGLSNLRSKTN